jgi:hypothetical protein
LVEVFFGARVPIGNRLILPHVLHVMTTCLLREPWNQEQVRNNVFKNNVSWCDLPLILTVASWAWYMEESHPLHIVLLEDGGILTCCFLESCFCMALYLRATDAPPPPLNPDHHNAARCKYFSRSAVSNCLPCLPRPFLDSI